MKHTSKAATAGHVRYIHNNLYVSLLSSFSFPFLSSTSPFSKFPGLHVYNIGLYLWQILSYVRSFCVTSPSISLGLRSCPVFLIHHVLKPGLHPRPTSPAPSPCCPPGRIKPPWYSGRLCKTPGTRTLVEKQAGEWRSSTAVLTI
jgi:hypothetical protein